MINKALTYSNRLLLYSASDIIKTDLLNVFQLFENFLSNKYNKLNFIISRLKITKCMMYFSCIGASVVLELKDILFQLVNL